MPNIIELPGPNTTLQPNEQAANVAREKGYIENRFARETGQALGRGVSAALRPVGQALDKMVDDAERHTTFAQISHGAAIYSQLYGDLTSQWSQIANKSDPNDTSVMQGFREHVLGPSLEKFQQGFDGASPDAQRWAQSRSNELSTHFATKMMADMGTRAAAAVHKNMGDLERNYSNIVLNDPSALPHLAQSVQTDVGAMLEASPTISPADAARVQADLVPKILTTLAKTAGYGMANANPQAAMSAVNEGKFDKYLDAAGKEQVINYADRQRRAQNADDDHLDALAKRQKLDAAEDAMNGYINQILLGRGVSAARIAADPKLLPMQRENLIHFQHQLTMQLREKKETEAHPEIFRAHIDQMFITARDDPNNLEKVRQRIRDSFIKGELNPREEAELEQRFNALDKPMERNFQNQLSRVERTIAGNSALAATFLAEPGKLAVIINTIERDAHAKLDAERNKPDGNLNPLLDPASPQYLFRPEVIQSYITPVKAEIATQADKIRGKEAPKGPTVSGQIGAPPTKGAVEHKGYRFPNQAALDAYLKAAGR
jgi:hypothetical protein